MLSKCQKVLSVEESENVRFIVFSLVSGLTMGADVKVLGFFSGDMTMVNV